MPKKAPKLPDAQTDLELYTLTIYQALALFCATRMPVTDNTTHAVVSLGHTPEMNAKAYMTETMWSEADWLSRAQSRALERMGYVIPNKEKTHWYLTERGHQTVRWLWEEMRRYQPTLPDESSTT